MRYSDVMQGHALVAASQLLAYKGKYQLDGAPNQQAWMIDRTAEVAVLLLQAMENELSNLSVEAGDTKYNNPPQPEPCEPGQNL